MAEKYKEGQNAIILIISGLKAPKSSSWAAAFSLC